MSYLFTSQILFQVMLKIPKPWDIYPTLIDQRHYSVPHLDARSRPHGVPSRLPAIMGSKSVYLGAKVILASNHWDIHKIGWFLKDYTLHSGKRKYDYGKSRCWLGKLTLNGHLNNSYVANYPRVSGFNFQTPDWYDDMTQNQRFYGVL